MPIVTKSQSSSQSCHLEESPLKSVGVIGSRNLPSSWEESVGDVVEDLIGRGYHIASGGAIGADAYVLERLLRLGLSDHGTVYAAWKNYHGFPVKVRAMMRQFKEAGGSVIWGVSSGAENPGLIRAALLLRNQTLVSACYGLVAFVTPESRGSLFTLQKAVSKHQPVVVFPCDGDLPHLPSVKWVKLKCGGCWDGAFKAVYLR